jgi:GGDEF domain-containing protein
MVDSGGVQQSSGSLASRRWFWVGSRVEVQASVAALFESPPAVGRAADAAAGDVVVVDARADQAALAHWPHGHVFSGVRALKEQRGVAVYVVVDDGDAVGPQLARFCLADGSLVWQPQKRALDSREFGHAGRTSRRPSVDRMLERVEQEAAASGGENNLQRLLRFEREDSLAQRLQDPETGLFDGPYAAMKLDEEWKRAHRFHQPLSLLLVDIGSQVAAQPDADRRAVLADAAGVFLNECRDIDVLARFSPHVFLFLLPGTGPEGATVLANRIAFALRERLQHHAGTAPAIGLCSVPSAEIADRKAFLAVAEACLERARAAGAGGVSSSWQ